MKPLYSHTDEEGDELTVSVAPLAPETAVVEAYNGAFVTAEQAPEVAAAILEAAGVRYTLTVRQPGAVLTYSLLAEEADK